ncbi:aldehyde dehydrogenase family protein [Montanilutibacter psychrotolerans]|uniref:Aldehyde dehydrogenase family protein n=1 Tax=Montanilutibacter psychrotolerans TaxID=1327343 RepID=A0A3M8SYQ0_9GAMM|nr:aldehyde dehydrogenase family protein [Lysobacter psychrotolerans]RNF86531.1 aldehyde dehydrogenase family protein [Lysobacter psychrotolerans]
MSETLILSHRVAGQTIPAVIAMEQRNPADRDDLIVHIPEAGAATVATAAKAAQDALGPVAAAGIEARSDALNRIGRAIANNATELAMLIARETGKTVRDARGEAMRASRIFEFFAGEALRNAGERFESTRPGAMVEVMHSPVGVVGLITPWNFPIAIPAWKIAPALAFGNTVVWKPSEVSSASAVALMRIIAEARMPAGSVNLVLGSGPTGQAICAERRIDAVSFTGSEGVGRCVREIVAARGARVQLEMGGVNGFIVLADADLDIAVDCVATGAFFAAGQRCTATSRIIVEDGIADAFLSALHSRVQQFAIGDPRLEKTDIGPLASPLQKQRVSQQVSAVRNEGRVAAFGTVPDDDDCYFAPTLFDHVGADSLLAQEEIFGPVAGMFRVRDFDAAMALLNNSRHGLSAGLCTSSLKHAEAFKRDARAGMLMVNLPTAGVDHHAPFGGMGSSSYGPREQGRAARAFYTTMRTTYQRPA